MEELNRKQTENLLFELQNLKDWREAAKRLAVTIELVAEQNSCEDFEWLMEDISNRDWIWGD